MAKKDKETRSFGSKIDGFNSKTFKYQNKHFQLLL